MPTSNKNDNHQEIPTHFQHLVKVKYIRWTANQESVWLYLANNEKYQEATQQEISLLLRQTYQSIEGQISTFIKQGESQKSNTKFLNLENRRDQQRTVGAIRHMRSCILVLYSFALRFLSTDQEIFPSTTLFISDQPYTVASYPIKLYSDTPNLESIFCFCIFNGWLSLAFLEEKENSNYWSGAL